jgi:non-specific serine/threonine protein kinase
LFIHQIHFIKNKGRSHHSKVGKKGGFDIILKKEVSAMNTYQSQPWVDKLSRRELEVLQLISNGLSNREIAQELYLSIETIKWYNTQMYRKLGVKNRTQAANKAAELNLLDSERASLSQEKTPSGGNLPAQLTSYVGREKEIGEIKELLKNNRLVVLTGAGGSGKTRLALKVGEELRNAYRDGVWLVELANIHEPSLVLQAIAGVLNITERKDVTLSEALKRYLSRRQLLLLIDNLEHLLECAPLIGELLAAAPQLSVIGTSRERLHIYGEQEYPVYPLNLPDPFSDRTTEKLKNVESIALFIKRALAVHPTIPLDDEALEDVARICVRLDGLPLAIELCTPMVKVFPLKAIADRIEKSLDAIPSGPRDLPTRQQTLRSTIQWSFDLLDENEKHLFERLAVFNGGGTLQAVKAICGDGIPSSIGNILSALVNKNLVLVQERRDGEIHFSLLETIRQYGRDRLLASKEAEQLADRHTEYFMKLAKQGAFELRGPNQIIWTDRFITLYDNLRAALERAIETGEIETALQFVRNLYEFWLRHSDYDEGRWWTERVIALPKAQHFQEPYTEAFNHLSWLSWLQGKTKEARNMAEQALLMARSQSNKHNTAEALLNLGMMLVLQKDDFARGQAYMEESKDLCQEVRDEWLLARSLMDLAVAQFQQNEYNSARSLYSKSFDLFKKLGDIGFQCVVMRLIGDLEAERNNLTESLESYRESLTIAWAVKSNSQIAYNFWGLARVEKVRGNHRRAVGLYMVTKRILDDMGAWSNRDDFELDEEFTAARALLGEVEFQSVWDTSQNMTIEEAIKLTLYKEGGSSQ